LSQRKKYLLSDVKFTGIKKVTLLEITAQFPKQLVEPCRVAKKLWYFN
jgi:hypothetical protein